MIAVSPPSRAQSALDAAVGDALDDLLQQRRVVLRHGHVVEEEQRLGPAQRASLTLIATRSMPTVLWTPVAAATLSLVPTPSVQETSTGSSVVAGEQRAGEIELEQAGETAVQPDHPGEYVSR